MTGRVSEPKSGREESGKVGDKLRLGLERNEESTTRLLHVEEELCVRMRRVSVYA